MDSRLLHLLVFLSLGLVATHGALSPELYWKSVLPNTVMPKAITDVVEEQSISTSEAKGGKWIGVIDATFIGYSSRKEYKLAATENENPNNLTLFFLEKDIHTGSLMNLDFTTNPSGPSFLPRQLANSIPFSSKQFPQILNHFSTKPGSLEAKVMEKSIEECEKPAMKGEDKYCATSLESMVDFITSKLGTNVEAVSTETEKETRVIQKYTIISGLKKMNNNVKDGDNTVVCHRQNYPYAVFYCHVLVRTRAYVVPMVGADGTKAKAVAVCHTDTSEWNPKHLSFEMLKVKPGTSSICHFLQQQQFVSVPKN